MIIEGNGRKVAIITLHGITDGDKSSANSSKAQCDIKEGKVTRAREIRDKMLVELTKEIERANADDYLIFGDFNESAHSPNMSKLMVDNGLFEIFGEVHNVKSEDRDSTFKYGPNCTDAFL